MDRTEIRETVRRIFEEETDTIVDELGDESIILSTFEFDSVDFVSLIMHVEDGFRIRLSNEELMTATTIGALIDLIQSKLDVPNLHLKHTAA
jgi:acyl carrier protein